MSARTAAAFIAACEMELAALKPGNVHRWADGHGMTCQDFERSAVVAAPHLAAIGATVGERVLAAVEATHAALGQNTNLGILLLCAPLARAAEAAASAPLWLAVRHVLAGLTVDDAEQVFAAIRLANPGGLGRSPAHDVRDPARTGLGTVMATAAGRDRIAWNYVNDLADIFASGLPTLNELRCRGWSPDWQSTGIYLTFLATIADTHIVRKHGAAIAEQVREEATRRRAVLWSEQSIDRQEHSLLSWDAELKLRLINPGTSADLTVATLFADRLEQIRIPVAAAQPERL